MKVRLFHCELSELCYLEMQKRMPLFTPVFGGILIKKEMIKTILLFVLFSLASVQAGQIYWTQPLHKYPSIVISTIVIKKNNIEASYVTRVFDTHVKWQTLWKSYSINLYAAQIQHQIATHWASVHFKEPLKIDSHEDQEQGYVTQEDEIKWECSSQ